MTYDPRPIDTDAVKLDPALADLTERLAKNTHDTWAKTRLEQGWSYGPRRDDETKQHPCLVPFENLPEPEKVYDRRIAAATIKALLALGWRIEPPDQPAMPGQTLPAPHPSGPRPVIDQLQSAVRLDLRELLALWQTRDPNAWAGSAEPFSLLGQRLLRIGAPLPAHDVLAEGLAAHPANVRLRQLQGLALARSGATGKAHQILMTLFAEGNADGETLALLARTYKDLAAAAANDRDRRFCLGQAHERYADAYRVAVDRQNPDGALYAGINAASTALLMGQEATARQFACQVQHWCDKRLNISADYWAEATLGEAALILADWDGAGRHYARAADLGAGNFGDLASTRRQARLLLAHLGADPGRFDHCFRIGPVVVFTGHRIDEPGRPVKRFAPEQEPAVAEALARRLAELDAKIGFASAASGADILFLESLLKRGGQIHVVLPYHPQRFRADQAAAAGRWEDRYDRVMGACADVIVVSEQTAPSGPAVFEYANHLLYGWALLQARQLDTALVTLAVWDGKTGDGPGGTSATVAHWRRLGHDVDIIDLEAKTATIVGQPQHDAPAAPGGPPPVVRPADQVAQTVVAMLFADAVGFSKLTEEQVPLFAEHFLGAIAALIQQAAGERPPVAPLLKNTWGDGLFFVFATAREAGRFALDLCELVEATDWAALGLPAGLNLRIALHAGPVVVRPNPVTGQPDVIGTHVSRAARIEPITPPGHVYASRPFAALAAAQGATEFACDYVGQTCLAKGYGTFATYHVRRRT